MSKVGDARAAALWLYNLHKMEGLPYEPEDNGFVYSSTELEEEAA